MTQSNSFKFKMFNQMYLFNLLEGVFVKSEFQYFHIITVCFSFTFYKEG